MKNSGVFGHFDWIDPACVTRRWTFIVPHSATNNAVKNLWSLKPEDWRVTTLGMRTGFQVRSVQQAICITKLAYYNQGSAINELSKYVDPKRLISFTEKVLADSGINPDDAGWFEYLSVAYTEAYAQWLDSLGETVREDTLKESDNFIVTENKSCSNTRERNIVSALNIIGTSINRASKITEIPTRVVD